MDSIYNGEIMDMDDRNEYWEAEKLQLKQQIQQLENALEKSKKFHRKFAEDVIESEEIRNRDFDRIKRELMAVNKRQVLEIRELTKQKFFYENTCAEMMKEKVMGSSAENASQPTKLLESFVVTNNSITDNSKLTTRRQSNLKSKFAGSGSNFKISTKLFEDNKKLKEKVSALTKLNATLRLKVKQLENFKSKFHVKQQQKVADQHVLEDLVKSSTRTNSQIFNKLVLSQLDEYYKVQPDID